MSRRNVSRATLILVAIASITILCLFAWKQWEQKRADAHDRQLRRCHTQGCGAPTDCAIICARQFLERNGWLDPVLAKPEEAVLEFRDNVNFTSMAALVASRTHAFKDNPTMVCTENGGYTVVFPFFSPDRPPWESGAVTMTKDFSRLRVSHAHFIFKGLPTGCMWTEWANR